MSLPVSDNAALYAEIRAKAPLCCKQRKALLSHWNPRVAKAICRSIYPDFRGNYEQHMWLLTHKAAEGVDSSLLYSPGEYTSYAREAKEKGVLFLWPYHYENTRLCGPTHYLYYILGWNREQVRAILHPTPRVRSMRLDAKYLTEALRLMEEYHSIADAAKPGPKGRMERRVALNRAVKVQTMLGPSIAQFQRIAYGWMHVPLPARDQILARGC